ncbi:MAG: hypothetical protein ACWA5P_03095 [bacterium]
MNKNNINFIVTIALAAILALFLPWWSVMLAAFVSALFIPLKKAAVFFVPFIAILLYWAAYSFMLSNANDFTLAGKISELLELGGNPYVLILMTGVVGGLAAGIAAIFGKQVSALMNSK